MPIERPTPAPLPPLPAAAAPQGVAANATGSPHAGESPHERGQVLIYVPRSFYYNMEIRTDDREPSREDSSGHGRTDRETDPHGGRAGPSGSRFVEGGG